MKDRTSPPNIRDFRCPYCCRGVGRPCENPDGRDVRYYHKDRKRLARRAHAAKLQAQVGAIVAAHRARSVTPEATT